MAVKGVEMVATAPAAAGIKVNVYCQGIQKRGKLAGQICNRRLPCMIPEKSLKDGFAIQCPRCDHWNVFD